MSRRFLFPPTLLLGFMTFMLAGAGLAQTKPTPSNVTAATGGVAVGGNIVDSKVFIGLNESEIKALLKAQGQEQAKLLQQILIQINKQPPVKARNDSLTADVVRGFLATITGKQIPEHEWARTFNEIAAKYLALGERIRETPVTSQSIQKLIAEADVARKASDWLKADSLLKQAEQMAFEDAKQQQKLAKASAQQSQQLLRQSASLLVSRSEVAFIQLERVNGARLLEQAFERRADDVSHETLWWLFQAGDAWRIAGQTEQAKATLTKALLAAQKLVKSDPSNSDWQRDLSVSFDKVAVIYEVQGNRGRALERYESSLAIIEKLLKSDPSNSDWQRHLWVSLIRVAGIYEAQGDRVRALERYESSLAIIEKLVKSDPSNSDWQRDLSVSHNKVAGIYKAQGDRVRALERYESSLAISEKLVKSDPSNSDWQRDLSVNLDKVAGIYEAQGDRVRALERYESSLAIREKLVKSDPSNSDWQRDLSVSFDKVAVIYEVQGERVRALERYESSLAIREKLVKSDPSNALWQADLMISYVRLSNLYQERGDRARAKTGFNQALEIALKLQRAGALAHEQKVWPDALRQRLAELNRG